MSISGRQVGRCLFVGRAHQSARLVTEERAICPSFIDRQTATEIVPSVRARMYQVLTNLAKKAKCYIYLDVLFTRQTGLLLDLSPYAERFVGPLFTRTEWSREVSSHGGTVYGDAEVAKMRLIEVQVETYLTDGCQLSSKLQKAE